MSPSSLTISTTQRLLKSSSGTNPATKTWCRRTCLTRNSTTRPSAERSLHHYSFRSERNQRTEDRLITLLKKLCCQLSPFQCVTPERGDPCSRENQVAKRKTKPSGFSLKDKEKQILVDFTAEIQKHEFHADSDRRSIQELSEIVESQRREIN